MPMPVPHVKDREWQKNASYGTSSYTELWFGPVEALRNGGYISLNFVYPGDLEPRSLLLRANDLAELAVSDHGTRRTIGGETYISRDFPEGFG